MKKQFTFDHVRHEPSFNNQPDASWNVKKSGIKSQENGDPLVIRIVQVRSVVFFARTGELESCRHIKTAVHPTETVQDVIVHTVFSLQKRRYSTDDIFKTKCNASLQMYIRTYYVVLGTILVTGVGRHCSKVSALTQIYTPGIVISISFVFIFLSTSLFF